MEAGWMTPGGTQIHGVTKFETPINLQIILAVMSQTISHRSSICTIKKHDLKELRNIFQVRAIEECLVAPFLCFIN